MRFMPTSAHGMLDYLVGLALLAVPWLFGFADNETARWVTMAFGAAAILYSLLTDYELGVIKVIPMSAHLILDIMSGVLLAASPWLFGFSEEVWIPHVTVGVFEIIAALLTQTEPDRDRGRGQVDAYR
jgi:hypothetical protein